MKGLGEQLMALLSESSKLPKNTSEIGEEPFSFCTSLVTIEFPVKKEKGGGVVVDEDGREHI